MTDNNGKTADFRHVVLIMTSNVGARDLEKGRVGFAELGQPGGDDDKEFKNLFSPEFRNRLDARVKFGRLSPDTMRKVVDKFLAELQGQLHDRKVVLDVTTAAKAYLGDKGYDPKMGARPMARLIHDELRRPLADEVLFGNLQKGGTVTVDVEDVPVTADDSDATPKLRLKLKCKAREDKKVAVAA